MKAVYIINSQGEGKEKKSYWNRAGVVFPPNRDGSVNFKLDLFPGVSFQMREQEKKERK